MLDQLPSSNFVSLLICALFIVLAWSVSNFRGKPYPPGPRRIPFIGSPFWLPKDHEWLTFERWSKQYGSDLVHVDVLGSHMVVVNSAKAAKELFEKRSAIYSDRPSFVACTDLLGFDWTLVFCPYGERFKAFRKGFHTHLSADMINQHRPLELKSVHKLLWKLAESPEQYAAHLRHMTGAIILSIAFGIEVLSEDDPHVETAEQGLGAISIGTSVPAAMFDFIPILKQMPSWFPGAGLKAKAGKLRQYAKAMVENPMQVVLTAMAEGKATPSVASAILTELENEPQTEVETLAAKHLSSNMYLGGADTTVCALQWFILAMTLYPDVQRKAQAEIDSVVGHDRLPDFNDQPLLPYIDAMVKEVLRWRNVTPLGVWHRLTEDDVYEDFWLPAGSTVIGNIWAILHDESIYPDPLCFKPERFLDSSAGFPDMAFGFGRRICPGMDLARESVWLAVVSILATLEISKARDENGEEIEPIDDCTSGIVGRVVSTPSL